MYLVFPGVQFLDHVSCRFIQTTLRPCFLSFYSNNAAPRLHSTTRLFADDIVLPMTVKGESGPRLLRAGLDQLTTPEKKKKIADALQSGKV